MRGRRGPIFAALAVLGACLVQVHVPSAAATVSPKAPPPKPASSPAAPPLLPPAPTTPTTIAWHPPPAPPPAPAPGYLLFGADGGVFSFGGFPFLGSAADLHLPAPFVADAGTRDGHGYWLATTDGGVFTFGDAHFAGSAAGTGLTTPVVALVATVDEAGYWLITSGGDIVPFGTAIALPSPGPLPGGAPVVAAARAAGGKGLWLADINGHVRSVGAAAALSPLADTVPQAPRPLVGIASTPSGLGYWTVYLDGTVQAVGDAVLHGSLAGMPLAAPVAGLVASADGGGYTMVAADGGVFTFGTSPFLGSAAPYHPAAPVIGLVGPGSSSSAGALLLLGMLGQKTFSLTFDDGPNPPYTELILDTLAREHVLATFFDIGNWAARYPDVAAAEARAGHVVANHTLSHPVLTSLDPASVGYQIDRTQAILQGITGRAPRCVRPPYGATNAAVADAISGRGLQQQMWTVDTSDYQLPTPAVIAARVLAAAAPGGNVLLHDGGGDRSRTVAALPVIIAGLRAMGFTLVPLCF